MYERDNVRTPSFTLGAGTIANPPPTTLLSTSFGTPSSIALSNRPIADTLLTLQASLHRVIVGAMGERTLQSDGSIASGTGRDGPIQSAKSIPKTREAMLQYVTKSPHVFHIHFAALEIEYYYLTLIYVTHSLLSVLRHPARTGIGRDEVFHLELERHRQQSCPSP
ncbi:hypothetical protein M422DRAFT_31034 [Sphaerobolus stellatus SS14]|uniref:Uncharacterized protein n=1 Tax=Sphaerobolus stellatus (strain SS14) TaxID=990650 RepID=A0A0C9V7V4_SPHS4|nr:hypothetical protein M422DRAFT_31034 [Sphaerobolus stellatus SS14]